MADTTDIYNRNRGLEDYFGLINNRSYSVRRENDDVRLSLFYGKKYAQRIRIRWWFNQQGRIKFLGYEPFTTTLGKMYYLIRMDEEGSKDWNTHTGKYFPWPINILDLVSKSFRRIELRARYQEMIYYGHTVSRTICNALRDNKVELADIRDHQLHLQGLPNNQSTLAIVRNISKLSATVSLLDGNKLRVFYSQYNANCDASAL